MVHSGQNKSLMERFNMTVDQLDYKYIENCKSVSTLERILRVLRSGEEGIYPHLTSFCGTKLKEKDPNNRLLHPAEKVIHYKDLPVEEREEILADIEGWTKDLSSYYAKKEKEKQTKQMENLPPVRRQKLSSQAKEMNLESNSTLHNDVKLKTRTPRSYTEWNKYNVDEELQRLDEDNKVTEEKNESGNNTQALQLSKSIPVTGLSQEECEHISNLERIKGNEAFKVHDFEEAVIYYTRSLSSFKTATSLTNRAQAYIKLKNYLAAVRDCNEAISMEPMNVKALYRRGIAHQEAEMYDFAIIDYNILLELDPENKLAKDKLLEVKNLKIKNEQKKKSIVIEELETKTTDGRNDSEGISTTTNSESGTRLIIEDVRSSEDDVKRPLLDDLCNCPEQESEEVQPLSQKTKEMLNVVKTNNPISVESTLQKNSITGKQKSNQTIKIEQTDDKHTQKTKNNRTKHGSKAINPTKVLMSSAIRSKTDTESRSKLIDVKIQNYLSDEETFSHVTTETLDITTQSVECISANERPIVKDNSESILKLKVELESAESHFEAKQSDLEEANHRSDKISNLPSQTNHTKETKTKYDVKITIPRHKITPFEFTHVWFSNKANIDASVGAECLLSVDPQQLPSILTNKLDGPFLHGVLMAIEKIIKTGEISKGLEYLKNLMKVPRINLAALFLSKEEKNSIKALFNMLEKEYSTDLGQYKEMLIIK